MEPGATAKFSPNWADCWAGITQCTVHGDKKQNTQPVQSSRLARRQGFTPFFSPISFTRLPSATIATEITPVTILRIPADTTMVVSALLLDFAKRFNIEPTLSNNPLASITPISANTPINIHMVPAVPDIAVITKPSTANPPGKARISLTE